jgi:formate dehydrogenase (NADP+) beta subunit
MPPRFSRPTSEKLITPEWTEFQPRTSPCEAHCPAGNTIQKVSSLLEGKEVEEALSYLRTRNPFPGITGRVCSHPCENACNRNSYDQPVNIRALERFAADHADSTRMIKPKKKMASGKRIAIIGSGPAGLTCAYFSALLGHQVTVLESAPVPGGIPRMAIPAFRLSKDVIEREVAAVFELGVQARFNTRIGRDISFQSIVKDYDACVIATGACKERRLDVPGADLAIPGVTFLQQTNLGGIGPIGQSVVIVGGGGVAFDCAFTAKRLGASAVTVVCVEGSDNMCATAEDRLMARGEGIGVLNSSAVKSVLHDGVRATGIEYVTISSYNFDERGCLTTECFDDGSGTISANTVISAIGVQPDLDFLESDPRLALSPSGTIQVNQRTFSTSIPTVFAAGDAVLGPSAVAAAIGSGRRAALAVDRYLSGRDVETTTRLSIGVTGEITSRIYTEQQPPHIVAFEEILNVDFHEKKERQETEAPRPDPTKPGIHEMDGGFRLDTAKLEATRCFHCGHCTSCGNCVTDCPLYVLSLTRDGPRVAHYDECWHCGCCRISCPGGAVLYEFPLNMLV